MITLATTDIIRGVAGTATAVTYTIIGMELNTSTNVETYRVLAQGQLPSSSGALYTVPATTAAFIKTIILTNATSSNVAGIYLNVCIAGAAAAAANQILSNLTLSAYGTAVFNQDGWKTTDTNGNIMNYSGIPRLFYNLPTTAVTSGTGETKLFNMQVPSGYAIVGTTFRIYMYGNSSSTGTLIFRVRVGALGTTGDNQVWISTTSAAQVANARAGFDVLVTVRSTIAAIADGVATAGAVTLPTLIGAPATAAIAVSSAWYIDVDCTCSVGTFTAQVGSISEKK